MTGFVEDRGCLVTGVVRHDIPSSIREMNSTLIFRLSHSLTFTPRSFQLFRFFSILLYIFQTEVEKLSSNSRLSSYTVRNPRENRVPLHVDYFVIIVSRMVCTNLFC